MTEGTPPGSNGEKPTDNESASTSDRVVFRDKASDEEIADQVRGAAHAQYERLKGVDEKERSGDFILYKRDGSGQFAVTGTPGNNLILSETVMVPDSSTVITDSGTVTRSVSVKTDYGDSQGNVSVMASDSEDGRRRGFEYVVDADGTGRFTKLFDTSLVSAQDDYPLLSGRRKQTALGRLANDLNAFGDNIAAEEAARRPETP